MNAKVLLTAIIVLTLITATIHTLLLGGSVIGLRLTPGFLRPAGATNGGGQGNGQANGAGPRQGNGGRAGAGGAGGFAMFRILMYLWFLNGLAYLALLALVVLPIPFFRDHPALTHWMLIGFAAITFIAYFALMGFGRFVTNPEALVAKIDEALLMIVTYMHLRAVQHSRATGQEGNAPMSPATPAGA